MNTTTSNPTGTPTSTPLGHPAIHCVTYYNGDCYIGECKNAKLHGFGEYKYSSGEKYIGFFINGKMHGIGTYVDSENVYKGPWRNDLKHGVFYRTHIPTRITYMQKYTSGKLIDTFQIEYKPSETLYAVKNKYRANAGTSSNRILDSMLAPTSAPTSDQVSDQVSAPTSDLTSTISTDLSVKPSGNSPTCIGCAENSTNATNIGCGHVVMCYRCLDKCDRCPICRSPIDGILKLYIC